MHQRTHLTLGLLISGVLAACGSSQPAPAAAGAPAPTSAPAPTPPAPTTAPSPEKKQPGEACGALGCRSFDSAEQAFAAVVAEKPLILAIGEAHALKGTEGIEPAVSRFKERLLPTLKGRASDLVLELLLPNGKCEAKKQEVKKRQQPVTEPQAESNQNQYVALGHRARELGIVPDILRPTCDDLSRITEAGGGDISVMLETIKRLAQAKIEKLVSRNESLGSQDIVLAYGGALHNDLKPRTGREKWSFGPELSQKTGGRYVELDLIVPEYIKDTESWRALPWFEHYDKQKHGGHAVLFKLGEGSYVLVFPTADKTDPHK